MKKGCRHRSTSYNDNVAKGFLSVLAFCLCVTNAHAGVAVSPKPYVLGSVAGFPITNGMVYTWVISLAIILIVRALIRKPQLIPTKGQAVAETVIEGIYNLLTPIVGKRVAEQAFPILIGFFVYILMQNWSGLLPGVGTIGTFKEGHFTYFFRPSNADVTIVAQKPKLAPFIPQMENNLASALDLPVSRINVKATTTEHLGFEGRMEGISAYAVCLIQAL